MSRAISRPRTDGGVEFAATGNATHLGRYRGSQSQSLLNDHGLESTRPFPQSFRHDASDRELEVAVCEAMNADRHMTLLQCLGNCACPKQRVSPLAESITAGGRLALRTRLDGACGR
jgi:hypothetical protein